MCQLPLLVLIPRQLPLLPLTVRQLHHEALSSFEVSCTMQPRTAGLRSLLVSTTPPSNISVLTTCSFRPTLLVSTTCWCQLLLISTTFGSTVCCSKYLQWAGYGQRILGWCRPRHSYAIRDCGPQETGCGNFGHASPKSRLLMARIGSSIVSRTLRTFDPAKGWPRRFRTIRMLTRILTWRVYEGYVSWVDCLGYGIWGGLYLMCMHS